MQFDINCKYDRFKLHASIILILSVIGLFLPLAFVKELPEYLINSNFAYVLKHQSIIRTAFLCSITTTIPIIIDISLDFFTNIKNLSYGDRIPLILMIIIPSSIYLSYYNSENIPYLFIGIINAQFSIIVHVVLTHVAGFKSYNKVFPLELYYFGIISNYLSNNFQNWSLLFSSVSTRISLATVSNVFYYCSTLVLILATLNWIYHIYHHTSVDLELHNEWCICSAYITAIWFSAFAAAASGLSSFKSIEDYDLQNCLVFPIYFTITASFLSILPGRLIRLQAANSEATLNLKRIFVRYVSHEIRSPLNIVYAGIEYMRSKLIEYEYSKELIDLTDEIFVANESAIAILNDLLHYESIDAGKFALDFTWKPLKSFFTKKLQSLSLLALKSDVQLEIIDLIGIYNIETSLENNSTTMNSSSPLDIELNDNKDTLRKSYLHVDIYRIDQVIRNLISNAIKFTPPSSKVTISFDVEYRSYSENIEDENVIGVLQIKVIDMGVGIKSEDQKMIFQEFGQIDKNTFQQGGGSGLGLWICQKIIMLHHGTIRFHSEGLGKGSTFIVELPLYGKMDNNSSILSSSSNSSKSNKVICESLEDIIGNVSIKNDNQVQNNKSPSKSNPLATTKSFYIPYIHVSDSFYKENVNPNSSLDELLTMDLNVLIVDDSSLNRKVLYRILQGAGDILKGCNLNITEADDGITAIERLIEMKSNSQVIDLIFMDFLMKEMHGPEAVYKIRNEYDYTGIIIGVTGNALAEDLNVFISKGVNFILTKPVNKSLFLNHVQNIVNNKRAIAKLM